MADVATHAPVAPDSPPAPANASTVAVLARRLYWLWPGLLTLGYGLWQVTGPALWADELATWGAVRLGWGPMYRLLGNIDAVVGPYYTLVKAWTSLVGTSTLALRLPSVAAMTGAAMLLAVLGARVSENRWLGLLAGLTFAVVPATTRYAQEARPYAFVIFFAILATLLLVRLVQRPSVSTAAVYALAVLGLGAFHLMALLLLLPHAAMAARRAPRPWAIAAACGVLPLLPLAFLGHRQSAQISWITPANIRVLLSSPDTIFTSGTIAGALILLGLLALSRRWEVLLLLSWAVVPVLALFLVAKITPVFWPRYLLYTMPAWVLLAAFTMARLSRVRAVAVLVVMALLAYPSQYVLHQRDGHTHGDSLAAGIITAHEQPGDAIAYRIDEQPEPWEGRDLVARYVPADRQPLDVFAVTPQRTNGRLLATECPDLAACLDRAAPPRMWIIRFGTQPDPLRDIGTAKEQLLRDRYKMHELWFVKGLTVALYVRG